MFPLELLSVKANSVPKEGYNKNNLVNTLRTSNGKIIIILLTEVVAFHIRFTIVHVSEMGFPELILRLFRDNRSLGLKNNLINLQ